MAFIASGNIHALPYMAVLCRRAGFTGGAVATNAFSILNSGASSTALPAYPTGEALELVSTSAEDGAGGATGMLTVRVVYLDGTTGSITSAVVTLNGTGVVALADTTITRVIGMHGVTFGSTGAAVGTITCRTVSGSTGRMAIDPMFRSAFPGRYTIPDGYTGYYRGFQPEHSAAASGTTTAVEYIIRADILSNTGLVSTNSFIDLDYCLTNIGTGQAGAGRPGGGVNGQNIVLPAGTTVTALARHDGAGSVVVGGRFFIELTTVEI